MSFVTPAVPSMDRENSRESRTGDSESVDNIRVAVRVRPLNDGEKAEGFQRVVFTDENRTVLVHPSTKERRIFTYDFVYDSFDPEAETYATQEQVFHDIGTQFLDDAFAGYNSCVFAYGVTGAGKSYSMLGVHDSPGLVPRGAKELFHRIRENADPESHVDRFLSVDFDQFQGLAVTFLTFCEDMLFLLVDYGERGNGETTLRLFVNVLGHYVECSYLEIYNEQITDLLNPSSQRSLRVREDPNAGPYVVDLTRLIVQSEEEILELLEQGNKVRSVAATNLNRNSSRSHAIFSVRLTQERRSAIGGDVARGRSRAESFSSISGSGFAVDSPVSSKVSARVSKIDLVDLAGSERQKRTENTGLRLREAGAINKSLVALGVVIRQLVDQASRKGGRRARGTSDALSSSKSFTGNSAGGSGAHISFRDSYLTWLLKESLGGNAKTTMLCAVGPGDRDYEETLSTLRYATQAKKIVNRPEVNEDPNARVIKDLQRQIETLKMELSGRSTFLASDSDLLQEIRSEKERLKLELQEKEKLIQEMSMTWEQKMSRTRALMSSRAQSLRDLAGFAVGDFAPESSPTSPTNAQENDGHTPYLVNLNEDILLNECLVYFLRKDENFVGHSSSTREQDIIVSGAMIQPDHAVITREGKKLFVEPLARSALVFVNGHRVKAKTEIAHGQRILFGKTHEFRLNVPSDATARRRRATTSSPSQKVVSDATWHFAHARASTRSRTQRTSRSRASTAESSSDEEVDEAYTLSEEDLKAVDILVGGSNAATRDTALYHAIQQVNDANRRAQELRLPYLYALDFNDEEAEMNVTLSHREKFKEITLHGDAFAVHCVMLRQGRVPPLSLRRSESLLPRPRRESRRESLFDSPLTSAANTLTGSVYVNPVQSSEVAARLRGIDAEAESDAREDAPSPLPPSPLPPSLPPSPSPLPTTTRARTDSTTRDRPSLIGAMTPLHVACKEGDIYTVDTLLASGEVNANAVSDIGETPLHCAVRSNSPAIVTSLLEASANVHLRDARGQTPLHVAVRTGRLRCAEVLLEHGASVNGRDGSGDTPLLLAARGGDVAAVRLLCERTPATAAAAEAAATATAAGRSGGAPSADDAFFDSVSARGRRESEAFRGADSILKVEPTRSGADLTIRSARGDDALLTAVRSGHRDVVRALLTAGAARDTVDRSGSTALLLACRAKDWATARVLISAGAKVDLVDNKGKRPIEYALADGAEKVAALLAQHSDIPVEYDPVLETCSRSARKTLLQSGKQGDRRGAGKGTSSHRRERQAEVAHILDLLRKNSAEPTRLEGINPDAVSREDLRDFRRMMRARGERTRERTIRIDDEFDPSEEARVERERKARKKLKRSITRTKIMVRMLSMIRAYAEGNEVVLRGRSSLELKESLSEERLARSLFTEEDQDILNRVSRRGGSRDDGNGADSNEDVSNSAEEESEEDDDEEMEDDYVEDDVGVDSDEDESEDEDE